MNTMVEILSLIVGAGVAGFAGIGTVCFSNFINNWRSRKYISRAIWLEVAVNQKQLHLLFAVIEEWEKGTLGPTDTMTPLEKMLLRHQVQVKLYGDFVVRFDRTVYLSLSDKIGLLPLEKGEKVLQYYAKMLCIEDGLKRDVLLIPDVDINEIMVCVKDAYKLNEELIKSLKIEGLIKSLKSQVLDA